MENTDETPKPAEQPPNVDLSIDHYMDILITSALRGAVANIPALPPQAITIAACRILARFVGLAFNGETEMVLETRRLHRDAFNDAMDAAPPPQLPPGLPANHPVNGAMNGSA